MPETEIDRSDPEVRAQLALARFERRQFGVRVLVALALSAVALVGPFVAAPLVGDPGATVGAIVLSVLLAGSAVAIWPWDRSAAEREHNRLAAIWAEARADDGAETPWDRYAAWAEADAEHVELLLLKRAGTGTEPAEASPFSARRAQRLDAEDVVEATAAMERVRSEAADREAKARERHAEAVAAAERKPYEDALREVEESAAAEQRRAEAQMRRELAEQEAAERRAQASAVARALRRP
jgi:4-amino-4-deoxy-L-arabinose transferase-like glycosyltransferase